MTVIIASTLPNHRKKVKGNGKKDVPLFESHGDGNRGGIILSRNTSFQII